MDQRFKKNLKMKKPLMVKLIKESKIIENIFHTDRCSKNSKIDESGNKRMKITFQHPFDMNLAVEENIIEDKKLPLNDIKMNVAKVFSKTFRVESEESECHSKLSEFLKKPIIQKASGLDALIKHKLAAQSLLNGKTIKTRPSNSYTSIIILFDSKKINIEY
jgi:hypothetical protein